MPILVPPEGPRNRPLLALVGEAPGREEEQAQRPFVGASGRLLDQMLAQAGISRGECYITNVAKERPLANNFAQRYYEQGNIKFPTLELFKLHEDLEKELRAVNPRVIVAIGNEALKALTPHSSVMTYRGTMIDYKGLRILPTLHPAYLLRGNYGDRTIVEADLRKARRQAITPYVPLTSFSTDPSFDECCDFLRSRSSKLALDIETVNNLTRCVGFAWSKYEAISVPIMKGRSHAWNPDQECTLLSLMNGMLSSPDVKFLVQNVMYDQTVLAKEFGFHIRNLDQDTMLSHHLLYPELPKGLDFQSSIYTDHPMYWGYDSRSTESTAFYNCMDCVVTFECAEAHEAEMRKRGLWNFYRTVVNPAVQNLLYIQSRGVKIDFEAREKIKAQTQQEIEEIKGRLHRVVGQEINPWSPKQVAELVYKKWKLPIQIKPRTKAVTTDDDALSSLARKSPVHAGPINDILACRQKRVLISTFCDMALCGGRVHTSYNLGGTVTSRLASSATYDDIGGNLQNIPRGNFRKVFVADRGKVLIKADLSQAEYRVLIWKARITRVIDRLLYDPKFNIHMWNASENIYKIPIAQVTTQQYDNAKNGVYGANYGIGALKVSRMYNMEPREAKFIIDSYHASVPEVKSVYQTEIVQALMETRELVNPFGRRRQFYGRMDDDTFREAYSHYCQSTVADLILCAVNSISECVDEMAELGFNLLLQVHDELVAECDEDKAEQGVMFMRKHMEREMVIPGAPCPLVIPCNTKIGINWFDMLPLDKWKESRNASPL